MIKIANDLSKNLLILVNIIVEDEMINRNIFSEIIEILSKSKTMKKSLEARKLT